MPSYALFLRGINVGGKNPVPMKELQKTLAQIGLTDIKTYLQSGNVACTYPGTAAELKSLTESALSKTFDYEAYVVVVTKEQLAVIANNYPWPDTPPDTHRYILFAAENAPLQEIYDLAQPLLDSTEKMALGKDCLYWQVPRGITITCATGKLLGKPKYKATTTMRNLNTLEKML